MSGVYRKATDKARGKLGKWTAWYKGADGKKHSRAAYTDRQASLDLARELELEAARVRDGLVDPGERKRREASHRSVADHVHDYSLDLLAKGDTKKHADHVRGVLDRLLVDAAIDGVADLAPDRIQAALGRLRAKGKSARTLNHALRATRAFAAWLMESGRIKEIPRGLSRIPLANEDADRRRVRRALTPQELDALLAAAEAGPFVLVYGPGKSKARSFHLTGPARAALYRTAMGTGFRAEELRSLTPESFSLDGEAPRIVCKASYTKNGREAVQPITVALAGHLRAFLADREPGKPVFQVPTKLAQMLRADLEAAGIPYRDSQGRVVDFHALRHSYITHLIQSGADPKTVQELARHSTITLTIDRYSHTSDERKRQALEGK